MSSNRMPDFPSHDNFSSLNEENKLQADQNTENIDNLSHTGPYDQYFQYKDDYSLAYIFTQGLQYCSTYNNRNHPTVQMDQTPMISNNEDTLKNGGNMEGYQSKNSSTDCLTTFHETNPQFGGASTQKEFNTLHTLGSSSSNSNKRKGTLNTASKPPRPPTSRFAPANNTGKRKSLTMAERAHPVKEARKANPSDFNYSMLMEPKRRLQPSLMFQSVQLNEEVTNNINTGSSFSGCLSSSSSGSAPENPTSFIGSLGMQTPTVSGTDFRQHGNGEGVLTNTSTSLELSEADMYFNFDWCDDVRNNDN